jgi:hypothetical protein
MYKKLLKDKVEESIKTYDLLDMLLKKQYGDENPTNLLIKELEDFLLTKEDIYNFSNFRNLFYEQILELEPHRFGYFLRNVLTEHPFRDRTYQHLLNDIEGKLEESYNIPNEYIKKKRSELDNICDDLMKEEKYFELTNLRRFIKENFRVYDFGSYIKENRDLAIKVLKSVDEDETNRTYIRLRKLLESRPGDLGLFTYFNKIEKIPFNQLKLIYDKIQKLDIGRMLNQLPEPIGNYMRHKLPYKLPNGQTYTSHYERLTDDLTNLEELHVAKLFADRYPGRLKRDILKNTDFIELIKELTSDDVKKLEKLDMYNKFFLRKISRYQTQEELIDALTKFVFNMDDDQDIRSQVTNDYSKVVYDNGDLLVIRIMSHEELQKLGSDTSWCIKDSLGYWCDYVNTNTVQLMIVDFTAPVSSINRKIGVTLNNNDEYYSFNTAHLKNDRFISEGEVNKILEKHNTNLQELYDIGKTYGDNEYYSEMETDESGYRGGW